MESFRKGKILYSEPVTEIISNPPARIIRFGTVMIFLLFLLFILFAWIIKYPDVIPSPVVITTTNPPVTLVSKVSGHIMHLYVKDKEEIPAGKIIAVMETSASINEIRLLGRTLDTMKIISGLPELSELGELQEYYAGYRKNYFNLCNYNQIDFYGNKIKSLNQEINSIKEYVNRLVVKEKYFSENLEIEKNKYRRDSVLMAGNYISDSQFEDSRLKLLKNKIDLQQVRLDHSGKLIDIAVKQQLIQDYAISRNEERERLTSILEESFLNLKARLKIWENNYLLISPVDGTTAFTKYQTVNQSVIKDEPVLSIIPHEQGDLIGRISLRMQRSGKVSQGQVVNIKLSGYPYLEYGMLRGKVKSMSLVPSGDTYIIEVSLPDGLTTIYGNKLTFTQNMQGLAEIITEKTSLLQKIINPFRQMIAKNKL